MRCKIRLALGRSSDPKSFPVPADDEQKDFTVAVPVDRLDEYLSVMQPNASASQLEGCTFDQFLATISTNKRFRGSLDTSIDLVVPCLDRENNQLFHTLEKVRALFCVADCRRIISVTLRLKTRKLPSGMRWDCSPLQVSTSRSDDRLSRNILPLEDTDKPSPYIFNLDAITNVAAEILGLATRVDKSRRLISTERNSGLIIVAGATKSCKTEIAKGICLKSLVLLSPAMRECKHFVTFEDPIEQWSFTDENEPCNLEPMNSTQLGLWFTPRQLAFDSPTLRLATHDALRQTPACFYIGEVRNPKDWPLVVDLAASGHLVVTTTHAGSLSETFTRLFKATQSETPATRAMVVNALRGVIHIKGSLDIAGYRSLPQVFPAVWKSTTESVATLISDGISSICPDRQSVFGRYAFASLVRAQQLRLGIPERSEASWCSALDWATNEDLLEG